MSIKAQSEWLGQMAYLLATRRHHNIGEEDTLKFILREGFKLELERTPRLNLLRLKRMKA